MILEVDHSNGRIRVTKSDLVSKGEFFDVAQAREFSGEPVSFDELYSALMALHNQEA